MSIPWLIIHIYGCLVSRPCPFKAWSWVSSMASIPTEGHGNNGQRRPCQHLDHIPFIKIHRSLPDCFDSWLTLAMDWVFGSLCPVISGLYLPVTPIYLLCLVFEVVGCRLWGRWALIDIVPRWFWPVQFFGAGSGSGNVMWMEKLLRIWSMILASDSRSSICHEEE